MPNAKARLAKMIPRLGPFNSLVPRNFTRAPEFTHQQAFQETAMARHPSGNPDLIKQHIEHQQEGDEELGQDSAPAEERSKRRAKKPGTGRPDAEEGTGTVRNQRR
jgi:hypothetical protein